MFNFIKRVFKAIKNFFSAEPVSASLITIGTVVAIVNGPALAVAMSASVPAVTTVIAITLGGGMVRIIWNYR